MPDDATLSPATRERLVRVFISSTFRDMHREREVLSKRVYPEIRRRCRKRGVEFVEVDLRWGITEEQTERGQVLPICLAEIERCRPYFIGVLGERYGYVPAFIDEKITDLQPWLRDCGGRSLTELEIFYGALRTNPTNPQVFFYFRDPAYIQTVPLRRRRDFIAENPQSSEKLRRLKEQIRGSGYYLKEPYPNPDALGEYVLRDLWQAIDRDFPLGTEPSALDSEAAEHEAFAASRRNVYIVPQQHFRRLDSHVAVGGPPLVVVGKSGSGKSALLANWTQQYQKTHPNDFVFLHFIGSTPESASFVAILRRMMSEIRIRFHIPNEVPSTVEKLQGELPQWLAIASANNKCILVIDALNQLEDRDPNESDAPKFDWLAYHLPSNVRAIFSASADAVDTIWCRSTWHKLEISGFVQREERQSFVVKYLALYGRNLNEAHVNRIVAHAEAVNPLYLSTLLDELRLVAGHDALDNLIGNYLKAKSIVGLYDKVLKRLERDYNQKRSNLVRDATSAIWAARRGLAESELLELLHVPHATWAPLHLAIDDAFVNRSLRLGFSHEHARQAIQRRYLSDLGKQLAAHNCLVNYFDRAEISQRKAEELPYQLKKAIRYDPGHFADRLEACLCDTALVQRMETHDISNYWKVLERWDPDRYDRVSTYINLLQKREESRFEQVKGTIPDKLVDVLLQFAQGEQSTAEWHAHKWRWDYAEENCRRLLRIQEYILGSEHSDTIATVNFLAAILSSPYGRPPDFALRRYHTEAERLRLRVLVYRVRTLGPKHPDTVKVREALATLLKSRGATPSC